MSSSQIYSQKVGTDATPLYCKARLAHGHVTAATRWDSQFSSTTSFVRDLRAHDAYNSECGQEALGSMAISL